MILKLERAYGLSAGLVKMQIIKKKQIIIQQVWGWTYNEFLRSSG